MDCKAADCMWLNAGLLRDAEGLHRAEAELQEMERCMPRGMTRRAVEARNLFTVAGMIVQCALGREESRGAHFRKDFPTKSERPEHSILERGRLRFESESLL